MSSFKYEQTQVLTLIYQANKENFITDEEKKNNERTYNINRA